MLYTPQCVQEESVSTNGLYGVVCLHWEVGYPDVKLPGECAYCA